MSAALLNLRLGYPFFHIEFIRTFMSKEYLAVNNTALYYLLILSTKECNLYMQMTLLSSYICRRIHICRPIFMHEKKPLL